MTQDEVRAERKRLKEQLREARQRLMDVQSAILALQDTCDHPDKEKGSGGWGGDSCNDCGWSD